MKFKSALKSLSFLWAGSLIGSGSTFIIYIILAREIGPAMYGLFSSALAIMMIFSLIAGFGIPQVWLKFFGKEGWNAVRWIKPSVQFVGLTLLVIIASVLLLVWIHQNDRITGSLLLLLIFFVIGYISVRLVSSKLQLEERYTRLSLWQLLPNFSRLLIIAACFYLLGLDLSVTDIGVIYAVVGFGLAVMAFWELNKMMKGRIQLKGHNKSQQSTLEKPPIKEVIRQAWPFGFAGIFAFIYIQSDIIMLKYLISDSEAGYYNVAFTILFAIMTIPTVIFSKFLSPKYHRWVHHDLNKFFQIFKEGNKIMIISGIGICLAIVGLSSFFIPLLFGDQYGPSISLTNILACSVPFTFLAYGYGATLLTSEHMKLKVRLMGMVAIVNIILNAILINVYGAIGAAVSTVLSNVLLMFLYRHYTWKKVFNKYVV
ncbi:MAG: flippase [Eudoraea sp.]|nr:flippase [Eudoraea sp.]